MPELFQNKYRTKTLRLKDWNYSWDAFYFITICTYKGIEYFGKIKNQKIILNNSGKIVRENLSKIPKHFHFTELDEHIVMPNHVHVIVRILPHKGRDAINRVSTNNNGRGGVTGQYNPMGKQTIGEIVRWYKGLCTFQINQQFPINTFQWLSRFYDHIIRNQESLENIRHYIKINPEKWGQAKNNSPNLYY